MSNEINPLETRSLPGALWEKFPKEWAENDEALRAWFTSVIDGSVAPWRQIRWLTESNVGVTLVIAVFGLSFVYLMLKNKAPKLSLKEFAGVQLQRILFFVLAASLSNLISVGLKRLIGRLKPHVNWWDKAAPLPALSCPSSHAFNTAFLCVLVCLLLNDSSRKRWRVYLATLGLFTFLIGVSRIIFTQHYPLDVLLGWVLGAAFAAAFAEIIKKLKLRIFKSAES